MHDVLSVLHRSVQAASTTKCVDQMMVEGCAAYIPGLGRGVEITLEGHTCTYSNVMNVMNVVMNWS